MLVKARILGGGLMKYKTKSFGTGVNSTKNYSVCDAMFSRGNFVENKLFREVKDNDISY